MESCQNIKDFLSESPSIHDTRAFGVSLLTHSMQKFRFDGISTKISWTIVEKMEELIVSILVGLRGDTNALESLEVGEREPDLIGLLC